MGQIITSQCVMCVVCLRIAVRSTYYVVFDRHAIQYGRTDGRTGHWVRRAAARCLRLTGRRVLSSAVGGGGSE